MLHQTPKINKIQQKLNNQKYFWEIKIKLQINFAIIERGKIFLFLILRQQSLRMSVIGRRRK
jgi:hypothetical protein